MGQRQLWAAGGSPNEDTTYYMPGQRSTCSDGGGSEGSRTWSEAAGQRGRAAVEHGRPQKPNTRAHRLTGHQQQYQSAVVAGWLQVVDMTAPRRPVLFGGGGRSSATSSCRRT